MRNYNKLFHRTLSIATLLAATTLLSLTGCTKVDDTLGSNLVPDNQQMKAGFVTLDGSELNPKKYIETRLFQTDSIISSNITYGYMGSMLDDTLGLRTAGFLSQYISYYKVDANYFGYRPIFDSVQIMLSIKSYGGDTTLAQRFDVYEVTSNKYLTEKPLNIKTQKRDSIFYLNFDPQKEQILGEKLFSFELGDKVGPTTKAITMNPTAAGTKFIRQLMLQEGKYKDDYSIYSPDSLAQWVEEFKGLYIKPEQDQTTMDKGAIYATELDAAGFAVYGRNRVKEDPTLIKDTIGMVYYFYDSYAKHGNVSINSIRHDYSKATSVARIDPANAVETNLNRPECTRAYVEGMGGVTTEITFTQEFFDKLEALLAQENQTSKKDFKTFAFSQVRLSVYFPGSDYDWTKIDPSTATTMIQAMSAAPSRVGLYTDYKKLEPIADYAYTYEHSYNTTLSYGGYINRSRGSFVMNITGYMQELWNSYVKEKKAAAATGHQPDLTKIGKRVVYMAPEAYSLYTAQFCELQGMVSEGSAAPKNNAPIRIDLAYNMIK
ncbi:MAG: DUF4270 family protein [Alistipes sp.]